MTIIKLSIFVFSLIVLWALVVGIVASWLSDGAIRDLWSIVGVLGGVILGWASAWFGYDWFEEREKC